MAHERWRRPGWWAARVYFLAFSLAGPVPPLTARSTSSPKTSRHCLRLAKRLGFAWAGGDLRRLRSTRVHDRKSTIRFAWPSVLASPDGKVRLQALISELEHRSYDAAASCLADDLDALVAHLRYPLRHLGRWRSTNLLERSLSEVRRRIKVIGRFPGETSCGNLI